MTLKLYLASTSPARLATLRAAGVEPIILPSNVDEDKVLGDLSAMLKQPLAEIPTSTKVSQLAKAKAHAVLAPEVDGFVVGGDSLFELDGVSYGKPHTPEVAAARIRQMSGHTGQLFSGHWLIDHRGGKLNQECGSTESAYIYFDKLSDAEIDAYVATSEPLEVAGSFTLDGLGSAFIKTVTGAPSCVIGLSVPALRKMAQKLGAEWFDFWNIHNQNLG